GRRDQPHHARQAGGGGTPRPLGPVDVAEPALPHGTGSEQRASRPALHADAPAGDGRLRRGLLRHLLPRRGLHPHRRAVTHARRPFGPGRQQRPGLHVSCLSFLRDHDVSVLVWDMLAHLPIGYDIPWGVHAALFAYGVALLDNALLEPLARASVEEGRSEFM